MKRTDRMAYVDRYERRLRKHGHSPQTLGWGPHGREHVRFGVMADVIEQANADSVLDVGCGFADLNDFLCDRGWTGTYVGIDLVPGLLVEARRRNPQLVLKEADIATYQPDASAAYDAVVASGVFNARLQAQDNREHIKRSVHRM